MLGARVRVGSIRGVDIRVDASWILIAVLFGAGFWSRFAPLTGYGHGAVVGTILAVASVVLFFGSILAHELAHALEAQHRGIEVGGITLFFFGGVTETRLDARRPVDEFAVSAIGPFVSLTAAALLGLVAMTCLTQVGRGRIGLQPIADLTGLLAWLNVLVAGFNLLPGAPLDGGRVLRALVWRMNGDRTRAMHVAGRAGQGLAWLIIAASILVFVRGDVLAGAFDVFIGAFLLRAASAEVQRARVRQRLDRRPVTSAVATPDEGLDLRATADAAAAIIERGARDTVTISDGERLVGIVTSRRVTEVPDAQRASTPLADVMIPLETLPRLGHDASLTTAAERVYAAGAHAVVRGGEVVGVVSESDLVTAIEALGRDGSPRADAVREHAAATPFIGQTSDTREGEDETSGASWSWLWSALRRMRRAAAAAPLRSLLLGAAAAAILGAWAMFVLTPMPYFIFSPARATSIPEILTVDGAAGEVTGDLLLTTVNVQPATAAQETYERFDHLWVEHDFDEVQPVHNVVPPDVPDRDEYFRAQRDVFDESVQVAAAVGLRLAGLEGVVVSGEGAEIVGVIPGSPADGRLRPGDVIVAVNGEDVELASRLVARTADLEEGTDLSLRVLRGGERLTVDVTIGPIPSAEIDRPGIGIYIQTRNQNVRLPDDVSIENTSNIGGPSAGLMLALTVYDLFDPEDLTRGREIAGTGTINVEGLVGPIGGIQEKVRGAELAEATIFLAPASQVEAAREVAPDGMQVFPVDTIEDAIAALRADRGG